MLKPAVRLFKRFVYRTKIRDKLIFSYVLLFGLWAAFFTFDSYERSVGILQDQYKTSMMETLEQVNLHLSYRFEEMEHISNLILKNHQIQQTLYNDRIQPDPLKQLDNYYFLRTYLSDLLVTYNKYQIELYLPFKTLYTSEELNFNLTDEIEDESWYRKMSQGELMKAWVGSSSSYGHMPESISLIRKVYNYDGVAGPQAATILKIDIDENDVTQQLAKVSRTLQGTTDIVDSDGVVIASKDKERRGMRLSEAVVERFKLGSDVGMIESGGGSDSSFIAYRKLDTPDWYIVTGSPKANITQASASLRNLNFAVLLLLMTASLILVIVSTKAITRRIHQIGQRMSSLDYNRFDDLIEIRFHDELSKVERKYNEMSLRLRDLIEEVYRVESKKKAAELKTLQAQINPHFLYNTLDTINWMAVDRENFEISKMVSTLGKFFRLALSQGRDVITVREELEITRLYLDIQQVRFSNRLDVRFRVDEALLDCPTVKLILQPIVENAIKHGVQNNPGKRGMIHIAVERDDKRIRAIVLDDGSEKDTEGQAHTIESSGYGMNSVLERLRLHFGEECSLTFRKHESGVGATVTLEWPALESADPWAAAAHSGS